MTICDFCGNDNHHAQTTVILTEASGAAICDQCVSICVEEIEKYKARKESEIDK